MPYLELIPGVAVERTLELLCNPYYCRLMAGFNLKNSSVIACSGS